VRAILNYLSDVRQELTKVTWPKKEEVIKLTLIVFLISGIVGAYVGGLDVAFTKLLETIITK
jgi:preprotein translocase subunit SecE